MSFSLLVATVAAFMVALVLLVRASTRRYRLNDRERTYRVCIAVKTSVSAPQMWAVIAELGNIQRYMPALRSSVLLGAAAPGEGAIRACEDRRGHCWTERCVRWDHGKAFDVVFDTTGESFPFPFSTMRGGWVVDPDGTGGIVRVWWEVTPRRRWVAPVLFPMMELAVRRDFRGIIARMAAAASGEAPGAVAQTSRAVAC